MQRVDLAGRRIAFWMLTILVSSALYGIGPALRYLMGM
jgi:hypothetical protein